MKPPATGGVRKSSAASHTSAPEFIVTQSTWRLSITHCVAALSAAEFGSRPEPCSPRIPAPPTATMRGHLRGAAAARFVRGPRHSNTDSGSAFSQNVRISREAASGSPGPGAPAGPWPPSPSRPCTVRPMNPCGGFGPAVTVVWSPISRKTNRALRAACAASVFPDVLVTPATSTSGCCTSNARARASSTPQSVSTKIRTGEAYAIQPGTGL